MRSKLSQLLAASAVLALTAAPASAATVIYQDDFSGDTSDLNGTTPDTTTGGATWVAASNLDANGDIAASFDANGDIAASKASATLAFTPVDGLIYTLEASLGALDPTGDAAFVALGFANGQSTQNGNDYRFISGTEGDGVLGRAWMYNRNKDNGNPNQAFLGDGFIGNAGVTDGASWTTNGNVFGGNMDLRIVLDTTGGTGAWTATWLVDTGAGFVEVRPETQLLDEGINSVGLANNGVSGSVESFSLTSVPEPGSLALLGLGGLLIGARRRRGS